MKGEGSEPPIKYWETEGIWWLSGGASIPG